MENGIVAKSKYQNAVIVLIGALLMGLLWRTRGTGGWGSSWGLLNVGFVYTMFIIVVKGARKKMNLAMLALTALSFMLTVPSWGTLLTQICGVLHTEVLDAVTQPQFIEVSVFSGALLMVCVGFGMATIYGIMLGRGYSDVKWKWYHFAVLIVAFFVAKFVAMATVSHWILNLIQPESAEYYATFLKDAGVDGSVYQVYMQHFNDLSWAKKLEGGRNYFSEIQAISSVFASIGALLTTRLFIKDKRAANSGLVVSAAFALSITVSDLFFFFDNGGYHALHDSYLPEAWATWELWEYFTGFIAGAIITAFFVKLKDKEDVTEHLCAQLPAKLRSISYIVLGYTALIGVSVVRPVLERVDGIVAIIAAVVIAVVTVIVSIKKFGYKVDETDVYGYSNVLLLFMLAVITVIYLFVGAEDKPNFRYIFDGSLSSLLFCISFVAVEAWGVVTVLNNKKQKSLNK